MNKKNSRDILFGLGIAIIAFFVYANSLGNGFTLDDHAVILDDRALKGNALSLFSMVDAVADSQRLPFYRPLTNLTFLFDGRLHGFNPVFIRIFNVLLHTANAFLVYRLARLLFKSNMYAPLLVGLLFATHPLHTEGVNFNAGGRITMMACFFAISAYLVQNRSILSKKTILAFVGALLFLAGLFSKEIGLMILPFILVRELPDLRNNTNGIRMQAVLRLAPYLVVTTIYLVMRWTTLSKLGLQSSILPGMGTTTFESVNITTDFGTRLLNNVYIIPRYFLTVLWPTALANRYVIPEDFNLLALPLIGAWLCILAGLGWVLTRGRTSVSLFGVSWLVLFWLPVSGIVFVPGAPLADRFLYIPAIGLWIIIADQIFRIIPSEMETVRWYRFAPIALILLVLAALTVKRNLDWKSNFTLHTRFVQQFPENVHARAGLGKVYYDTGKEQDLKRAEDEFDKVIAIDPNFPMIHTYLGNINLNMGDLDDALYHYGKALEVYPLDKEAHLNRGITLEKLGRPKEAYTDYLFFMTMPGSTDTIPGGRKHAEQRMREILR
ncbi:MAG: tetratricopeptide repeat protein [Desulfuromonadaceae bacterium]|nr:tetratricopeptide repeat protein [Desulfuromonadaceae bacterium]